MSLKGFHLVFVTLSTLMCMFLAVWSYMLAPEPSTMATILGVVGLVGTVLMPIYGVCFYRKISRIHI
jgi:hypothetical protein